MPPGSEVLKKRIRLSIGRTNGLLLQSSILMEFSLYLNIFWYRHILTAGEIVVMRPPHLGNKKRPMLILTSSYHNSLKHATFLVVPFTTKSPNPCLHPFKISPMETKHRLVLRSESLLLFDYSTMIEENDIERTFDGLQSEALVATTRWWRWTINSILSPFYWIILSIFPPINKLYCADSFDRWNILLFRIWTPS